MRRVLLTGMSGTGKSTLVAELAARGYDAVDADAEGWSEWVESVDNPTGANPGHDWLWQEERIQELLSTYQGDLLFVSGCAENMVKFYPQFDHIILLTAPVAVVLERLANRSSNPYGKRPQEVARVLAHLDTIEPALRRAADHEVDTTVPLDAVVSLVLDVANGDV